MGEGKTQKEISGDTRKIKQLSFFYLVSGITTLIVMVEGIMEELGWIAVPAEQSLPEPVYVIVTVATFIVGFTLVLGLPAAIVIFLHFGKRIEILIPAALLTGTVICMALYIITGSELDVLFWVGGTLLFLYGCSSIAVAFFRFKYSHGKISN